MKLLRCDKSVSVKKGGVYYRCFSKYAVNIRRINLNTLGKRVNITHTFKAIRKPLKVPAFCRKHPSP